MEQQATSVISKRKITHSLSKYIWDSPILKCIVYNPFILVLFTMLLIWLMDYMHGKRFKKCKPAVVAQHAITTYIMIACLFAMNNILIKHNYRVEKLNKHKSAESIEPQVIDQENIIDYTEEQQWVPVEQASQT